MLISEALGLRIGTGTDRSWLATGLTRHRYPGLASDIPSHTYQFTFEENTQWSSYYAGGAEI